MRLLNLKLGLHDSSGGAPPAPPSPIDIPSLVSWHDATDASTITSAGSGKVSQWADKSGNNHTFTQGTGANRPTTGTRTQNSLNVLDFNTGDRMAMSAFPSTEAQVNTIYIAAAFDSTAGSQYMIDGIDAANRNGLLITSSNFTALSGAFLTHGAADTSFHIFKIVYNGGASVVGVDGSDTTGNAGTQGTNGLTIGAAYNGIFGANGIIGEVLFFNDSLSAGDELSIETYLARWGT